MIGYFDNSGFIKRIKCVSNKLAKLGFTVSDV